MPIRIPLKRFPCSRRGAGSTTPARELGDARLFRAMAELPSAQPLARKTAPHRELIRPLQVVVLAARVVLAGHQPAE